MKKIVLLAFMILWISANTAYQPVKAQQQKQGLISVTLIDKGSDQPITLMQRDPAPTQSFSAIGGWLPDKPTISSGSNPSPTLFPIPKEDSLLSPNRIIGPDDRFRITTTGNWPWSTVVSVLVLRDEQYGLCSGWMVGASAIVTAGHCIFNASAITDKWAKEVIVTPGLDGSQAPFGQCKGFRAIAPVEWVNSGNTDYDWGIITLKCQIGYQTGVVGFSVTGNIIGQLTFLTGYSLGTPDGVDEGTSMWSGNGRIQKNNVLTFDYDNDTTSGQSGAVYWQPNNIPIGCSTPCIIGTHANSFDPIISPPAWNQGPRITQEVFDELYFWRQYKTHQVFISFVSQ